MNIVDKTALPEVEFRNLLEGDVFKYGGHIYMKTHSVGTGLGTTICNILDLRSGQFSLLCSNEHVISVNHELIIKP